MAGSKEDQRSSEKSKRRDLLANGVMGAGLLASHSLAAVLGVRYLYPVDEDRRRRLFVAVRSEVPPGASFQFRTPDGQTVNIVNGPSGFMALSDVCPHLGCRVHWEAQDNEFYCPCHDGHFDVNGVATAGPPAEMGARLAQYPLVQEGDILFIEISVGA